MNTVDESELPSQAVTVLAIKETCGLVLTLWKVLRFLLTNSRRFLLSAAFSWANLKQYLLELIGFLEGAYNGELPSNLPCTPHYVVWMKTSLWCDWSWFISLATQSLLFHVIVQYPLFIT